jgi:mRNA-degrading endonuclease RelE of RelBE toxin-antitoxin system
VSGQEDPTPYDVVVPGPVQRAISTKLSEAAAWAAIEYINGPLARNPHRVGGELRGRLAGLRSAHLGSFRIVYAINDQDRIVTVRRVDHRSDVYG